MTRSVSLWKNDIFAPQLYISRRETNCVLIVQAGAGTDLAGGGRGREGPIQGEAFSENFVKIFASCKLLCVIRLTVFRQTQNEGNKLKYVD